jgi:hypothetical protein
MVQGLHVHYYDLWQIKVCQSSIVVLVVNRKVNETKHNLTMQKGNLLNTPTRRACTLLSFYGVQLQ